MVYSHLQPQGQRWFKLLRRSYWGLFILWSLFVSVSLGWNFYEQERTVQQIALVMARTAFQKDVLYRRWNTNQGGVYVPITANTPPNPYLEGYPGRDVHLTTGETLTLVNPAYMTRMVFELQSAETGILGHITSLKPVRPENQADAWEINALQAFENGIPEVNSIETFAGQSYLRYMSPLLVEERCLKCHSTQGYQVGQVRGGIAENVPLDPLRAARQGNFNALLLSHAGLWLFGMASILIFNLALRGAVRSQMDAEDKIVQISTRDSLTGLYNRTHFEDILKQLQENRISPIAILAIDVDGLKKVNDELGHAAGDELLKRTAEVFKVSLRSEDIISRVGGDEFVIILPNTTESAIPALIARIRANLEQVNQAHQDFSIKISIGSACAALAPESPIQEAMRLADQRMYAEKILHKQKL